MLRLSIGSFAALALAVAVPSAQAQGAARHQHSHASHAGHAGMAPGPLGIPMTREASGTAWQPDATLMRGFHFGAAGWDLMLHGLVFVGFDAQGSDRGDEKLFSPNWLMAMAQRDVLGGQLSLRAMLSLDAVTMGERGYPLLLQSGEAVDGEPLTDRQHPHDLFMEVAASYTIPIGSRFAVQIYGGPVGEPALGPVAFPHRRSAAADPLAVLSHHWQDSTHIAFGVVTAGVVTRLAKIEASWFNGREPDQSRYDFDLRGFDAYSARLSVAPHPSWGAQVSYGHLESPEILEPGVDVDRVTASVMAGGRFGPIDELAATLVWGRNIPSEGKSTDAGLVEAALGMDRIGTAFARVEVLAKGGHDLGLPEELEEETFPIASFVAGYLYDFEALAGLVPGIGVRGSLNVVDDELAGFYGTDTPVGGMVFVRIEPAAHGAM